MIADNSSGYGRMNGLVADKAGGFLGEIMFFWEDFYFCFSGHSGAEQSPGQTKYIIGGSYTVGNVCAVRFRNS